MKIITKDCDCIWNEFANLDKFVNFIIGKNS